MATVQPDGAGRRELTWRALLLGGLLTFVFTAANVYFGLRVGLTFSTALPAAVISMALLRGFKDNSLVENNITQTLASSAGAVATMIFVLPGLVMVGWWTDFPYWTTALTCFLGGTLGVMMSVPLRRALVVNSDLPYPEGIAGAEVLRVGGRSEAGAEESRFGLRTMLFGGLLSVIMAGLVALKLAASEIAQNFRVGGGATGVSFSVSMGLIAIGHLIGLSAGIALFVGTFISWGVLLPWRTSLVAPGTPVGDLVSTVFSNEVRFIGAGAIAVASIWTLLKLLKPIAVGLAGIVAAGRARKQGGELAITERDLPGSVVIGSTVVALFPIAWLLWRFAEGGPVAQDFVPALVASLLFILVIGAVVSAVTGYMAGLVGTSNSPVSGVGILSILVAAVMIAALFPGQHDPEATKALVAYALFATAFVFGIALVANDNLQDLKTGQLVGSTPWKQQLALVIGVTAGSLVIPPVLNLLNKTMGFAGMPGAGPDALAAPQASLISSLAQGVLGGTLRWDLIALGGVIIAAIILVDELLGIRERRMGGKGLRLPPLGVAMGMYLPISLILPTAVGAVLGHIWDKRSEAHSRPEFMKRSGVLLATGIIVGDSLFGLGYAAAVAGLGSDPFAIVGPGFESAAKIVGLLVLGFLMWLGYSHTRKAALKVP
ncbi:oligopeptide transporter, OPT family [Porphyrobacter algicida]|uniref:Oligopeptide transporter, OPT family n=1 Tax=Qipengyuania algicida TaxID=1836209 RepID=A0A845AGQ4_9SPHN|nr:oligopeptide transporter, OPT family [Qipengyuania algicida]MXP28609.1 oligopeptide transporter, OPT family [Qipengyuania algicida]